MFRACHAHHQEKQIKLRREMWDKKWLLGTDRYTHLDWLNFFRNDGLEDYKNYLRMSDENVQYLIVKVKPLIAKQDTASSRFVLLE